MITISSCCDLTYLPHDKAPSGVYQLVSNESCDLSRYTKLSTDAYCDMETSDGGWMIIQRNVKDGVDTFKDKTWIEYEKGFGDLNNSKFWYGLKELHRFTKTGQWELRIDFQFDNKTQSYLHYNTFSVGTESKEYPLTIGEFTGITPTDPFATHPLNGQKFSTVDNDKSSSNCATAHSGWWHNNCYQINPNIQPPYIYTKSKVFRLLSMEMKIRPRNCIIQ